MTIELRPITRPPLNGEHVTAYTMDCKRSLTGVYDSMCGVVRGEEEDAVLGTTFDWWHPISELRLPIPF